MSPSGVVEEVETLDGAADNERPEVDELLDLHPDHRADLAKSGLTAATIRQLHIHTIAPRWVAKPLGFDHSQIESVLCFPYPGVDGFCRDKLFPSIPEGDGHPRRYLQRADSGVHLYIAPLARAALTDPSATLYLTGGEKKAAKACQEGFPCIGMGGLWNWLHEGMPIADLDLIVWRERRVMLVPDSFPRPRIRIPVAFPFLLTNGATR